MSQEHQCDVGRKYHAKLRSRGRRYGEGRPLDDALGDHLTDGSSSLGSADDGKGL